MVNVYVKKFQKYFRVLSEFEHPGPLNLSHLAVDRGNIYLAGGNVLYQLDQVIYRFIKYFSYALNTFVCYPL